MSSPYHSVYVRRHASDMLVEWPTSCSGFHLRSICKDFSEGAIETVMKLFYPLS